MLRSDKTMMDNMSNFQMYKFWFFSSGRNQHVCLAANYAALIAPASPKFVFFFGGNASFAERALFQ